VSEVKRECVEVVIVQVSGALLGCALLVRRESDVEPFVWKFRLLLDVRNAFKELQVGEAVDDLPVALDVIVGNPSIGKALGGKA